MPTIFATSRAAFFCPGAKKTAVAERCWFVVSFVTVPGWKPAFVSLSDALRARPVNVVPLRTATRTLPRSTFAAPVAPFDVFAVLVVRPAEAGGATVFGFAAGLFLAPADEKGREGEEGDARHCDDERRVADQAAAAGAAGRTAAAST